MSNKTTKQHFEIFKKEVRLWLKKFGLFEWRVDIRHDDSLDVKCAARASFWADAESVIAVIALSPDWGPDKVTGGRIKSSAFHEVLHLLFSHMAWTANARNVDAGYFEEEEHKVIRRLENLFYGGEANE
jgi:hypothetical protein